MGKKITWAIFVIFIFLANCALASAESVNKQNTRKGIIVEMFGININHPDYKDKIFITPDTTEELKTSKNNSGTITNIRTPATSIATEKDDETSNEHGTMVTSVIAKNDNNFQFIPMGGDIRKENFYTRLDSLIQEYDVKFVNMSLRFGVMTSCKAPASDELTFQRARSLMYMSILNNPGTLFVVASGNGTHNGYIQTGLNVDYLPQYPVSNSPDNIFSAGSINADRIDNEKFDSYQMSEFSNFGFKSVDVLAPGEKMKAAAADGSYELVSGTSFSTAYTYRLVLDIAEKNSNLSPQDIKEIIMKTVYIPDVSLALEFDLGNQTIKKKGDLVAYNDQLFPVRSGGIIFPERAFKTVQLLAENAALSIEEAALLSRKYFLGPGEENSPEKLEKLWKLRKI